MTDFKSSDRIRRAKHEKNYTVILNSTIQDSRLSWKARGLHHYILSLPDNWHICISHLSEQSLSDGEATIKSALKELETFGYLSKVREKDDRGRFSKCVWDIYESPQVDFPLVVKPAKRKASKVSPQVDFPQVDKPQVDKPQVDKPQVENRGLISNDQPSTDLISTDQQKKESDFFENSSLEQKIDPLSDLGKPESKDLEKTPPLPPLSVAAQKLQEQFEGRFKNKPNRYAPQGLVEAGFGEWHLGEDYDNWRPSLIKIAQNVKRELKQPCDVKDATKYLYNTARQSRIEGHWGTFKGMTKDAIALEQSQTRSLQHSAPQIVQEHQVITPIPSNVREYAAKLSKKSS